MRTFATVMVALVLLSQVRSAPDYPPAKELEVEPKLRAIQKQQEQLKLQEEALKKELEEARKRPMGGMKAEVAGVMKREPHGYCIAFRQPVAFLQRETLEIRIWLRAEDVKQYQAYQDLVGKEVIANGPMTQTGMNAFFKPQERVFLSGVVPSVFEGTSVPENQWYLRDATVVERKLDPQAPKVPMIPSIP